MTQDDLAQELRSRGCLIASSAVVGLERGDRAFRLSEALVLAEILGCGFADIALPPRIERSKGIETTREAERHASQRLGVPVETIVGVSYRLWGRTLSDERDARALTGPDVTARSRATTRSHVTRSLLEELAAAI